MAMETYLAEVAATINSGHWWERTWWRDSIYQTELDLRTDQIEGAFTALREIFSEGWANAQIDNVIAKAKMPPPSTCAISPWEKLLRDKLAEAKSRYDEHSAASSLCGMHPVFGHLFHRGGLDTFMFLYRMGSGLKTLKQENLLGDLSGRLKEAGEFEGACAEMNVLAGWVDASVTVKRRAAGKGNKNCDLKIWDGEDVIFIEVKRLENSPANKERSSLTDTIISHVLARLHAHGLDGLFEMELLLRPANRDEVNRTARDIEKMADEIVRHVEKRAEDKSGAWRVIDGLARYRHIADKSRGTFGGTAGVPLDESAEADKIMDEVREHADQIPEKGPGLFVIVGSGNAMLTVFGSKLLERIVERFTDGKPVYADIAGVLILRSIYAQGIGEVPLGTYVPNPNGPSLCMELLRRGIVNLEVWGEERPAQS